jgi:hypothetical protein
MKHFYKPGFFLYIILLIAGNYRADAQSGTIRGKVVDASGKKTIEYASALNFSHHIRTYSNSTGEFSLDAHIGDTLVLYAVGYYYRKIIVDAAMINTPDPHVFSMDQQSVQIEEVRIISLGTYEEFKEQFIHLDRPKTKTDLLAESLAESSRKAALEAYQKAMDEQHLNGITMVSVPIRTPEEKERILLAQIIEKEKERDQVYQKFNPVVVKKVTGLDNDDDIIEFMVFCNYSDAYLLQVNEYDLMASVARKFELFKKKKEAEKSMQNLLYPGDMYHYPGA